METTNKYLELSTTNTSKTETIPSVLEYHGDDLTEGDYTKLNIWKWNIISKNFPTWLPVIVNPALYDAYTQYVPPSYTANDVYGNTITSQSEYYITDWKITQQYKTPHPTHGKNLLCNYVKFPKPRINGPTSVEYYDDGDINKQYVLRDKTKFFWGDSGLLCNMINESLNAYKMGTANDFRFVKNGEYWSILFRVGLDIEKIYLNPEMRRLFDFHYDYDTGITMETDYMTSLNGIDYYIGATTIKTTTYLFPFRDVVMTFHGLNVFEQFISPTSSTLKAIGDRTPTNNILTRFTINVTDINQIGNVIEYSTESTDRAISLNDSKMNNFSIKVYLQTVEKYLFPIDLEKDDEVNILLMVS